MFVPPFTDDAIFVPAELYSSRSASPVRLVSFAVSDLPAAIDSLYQSFTSLNPTNPLTETVPPDSVSCLAVDIVFGAVSAGAVRLSVYGEVTPVAPTVPPW